MQDRKLLGLLLFLPSLNFTGSVAKGHGYIAGSSSLRELGASNPPGRKPNRDQLYPDRILQGLRSQVLGLRIVQGRPGTCDLGSFAGGEREELLRS
jgi:hypothetical protein